MLIPPTIKRAFLFLPWLILVFIAIYLSFFEGWDDLTRGRMHRKAQESFIKVKDMDFGEGPQSWQITEARVFLLGGEPSQVLPEKYLIGPGNAYSIYGTVTLKGKELDDFLAMMAGLETSYRIKTMCRPSPGYGFRLYDGTKLRFETAICWECGEVYIDYAPSGTAWYGFNSKSESASKLLAFCDKRLPYARKVK